METSDLDDLKRRFAAETLKNPRAEPFKIILDLGVDTGPALLASTKWPNDPVVLEEKQRLLDSKENGELDFLPTKADAARLAWDMANSPAFFDDRLKALKLYSEIRGYIAKPEAVKVENNFTNKVMVVKDHGSDADWEAKMREQQDNLKRDSSLDATRH